MEFLKKRAVDFEIVPDSKKIIEETFLTGLGYPTNIIIDKQGRIVEFSVRGGINAEEAKMGIERLKAIIVD